MNRLRGVAVVVLLLANPSFAQSISGTATISAGVPDPLSGSADVTGTINLSCSLVCTSGAPTLHYAIRGQAALRATGDSTVIVTGFGAGFATAVDSSATATGTVSAPAGSSFALVADHVTCQCGSKLAEGGYVTITSNTVSLPPSIGSRLLGSPGEAGKMSSVPLRAFPVAAEQLTVTFKGAGLDQTVTLGAADFSVYHEGKAPVTPTEAGDLVVTATTAQGASATRTFTITSASGNGGSGGGGDSSGTGGGGGAGTVAPGCAQVPGSLLWPSVVLLTAWFRRRAHRR